MKIRNLIPKLHLPSLIFASFIFLIGIFAFSKSVTSSPTASVAADKMNIFYIGIDNPITAAVAGIPSHQVTLKSNEATIKDLGNGHYNVTVDKPGDVIIQVNVKGETTQEMKFRVKRLPDPISTLNGRSGGEMSVWYFKQQKGIHASMFNLPLEEKCVIKGFEMTRQRKGQDEAISIVNVGETFTESAQEIIKDAQKGDIFYFDRIKCKCPGDPASRKINGMVFKIN